MRLGHRREHLHGNRPRDLGRSGDHMLRQCGIHGNTRAIHTLNANEVFEIKCGTEAGGIDNCGYFFRIVEVPFLFDVRPLQANKDVCIIRARVHLPFDLLSACRWIDPLKMISRTACSNQGTLCALYSIQPLGSALWKARLSDMISNKISLPRYEEQGILQFFCPVTRTHVRQGSHELNCARITSETQFAIQ